MQSSNLYKEINVDLIQEEQFDLDELIKETKEDIIENNILSNCEYDDDEWSIYNSLTDTFHYLDFGRFKVLQFIGFVKSDIDLLKCWIIDTIIESTIDFEEQIMAASSGKKRVDMVYSFVKETDNFKQNYINTDYDLKEYVFSKLNGSNRTKANMLQYIISFIDYLDGKVAIDRYSVLLQYKLNVKSIYDNLPIEKPKPRVLPTAPNILLFSHYIDLFTNDEDIPSNIKLYFAPIVIWWKLCSVIPMRPSEFCRRLKRDALVEENENYYLRINRIKKTAAPRYNLLPVLDRVKITKELFCYIQKYIDDTNKFGNSETLISYRAIAEIRNDIANSFYNNDHLVEFQTEKNNKDTYTLNVHSLLLKLFYKKIISERYKDKQITETIKPGDIRHIAFTSMMLQGYSPVDIAIIGGHRTLSSLSNYTCSVNTYIDTEVLTLIRNNIKINSKDYSALVKKVFGMPKECPVPLEDTFETQIDDILIGVCTAKKQLKHDISICKEDDCYNCSHWWCEPTHFNYLNLEQVIKKKVLNRSDKLNDDLDFIKHLMSEVGFEVVDGQLVIDPDVENKLKRLSMELESNSKSIIHLSYKMLDPTDETLTLLTKLEDILPTEQVNKYFDDKVLAEETK